MLLDGTVGYQTVRLRLRESAVRSASLPMSTSPVFRSTSVTTQSLCPAGHRVSLPVTDTIARLDRGRPLRDHALAGQPPAAVVGTVAPALAGPAQVGVEQTALTLVAPDVAVDGLVADREQPLGGAGARRPARGSTVC